MVLVMKLNAFCWNVADGLLPDDQLSDFQRDRMLKELPPLIDYAGYVLFFPSLFAGPAFDYSEYRQWIDTTMFDVPTTVEPAKRPPVLTGKISWNRLQNIDPLAVETAQNPRAYLGGWNMNTSNWLRNYIYLRVTPRGKKPGFRASLMTFGTSAFWHGFHPGYYMSFILASFIQTSAKNFRRYVRPFFLDPHTGKPTPNKKIYDFICPIATQLIFSFVVVPFLVLSFRDSWEVWRRLHYFAIVGVQLVMVFFASPAKGFLRKQLETRQAKGRFFGPRPSLSRNASTDSVSSTHPVLGVADNIEKDVTEMVEEIKAEIEAKQKSLKKD
ncbi:Lysophospholipid acyltransferase [Ceratocystis platani]|uniref:Lysophospholipid acyltransferase n=1 Tax=Ceratocystis fimbriata f. sp. platani TaxID=88771 RepID=A0A0F8AWF1_CERFI|nr:Lysophospholipid acyltransferase [Ceratocystis platani]